MHGCACVCAVESLVTVALLQGKSQPLKCWRENVTLHRISSVLGFCPFCSVVRLYWQEEREVKTVLFILLLS